MNKELFEKMCYQQTAGGDLNPYDACKVAEEYGRQRAIGELEKLNKSLYYMKNDVASADAMEYVYRAIAELKKGGS